MPKVDRSGHDVAMDLVHSLVHAESAFSGNLETGSISGGQNYDIRIAVGAKRHHSFGAAVRLLSGSIRFRLIEAPSNAGTGGTVVGTFNRWRGSDKTPTTVLTAGVTGVNTTGATANVLLGRLAVPASGAPATRVPTIDNANAEWTLKPNTNYIFRIEAITTADVDVGFLFYDIGN